jgi:Tol biopolymer transport system component
MPGSTSSFAYLEDSGTTRTPRTSNVVDGTADEPSSRSLEDGMRLRGDSEHLGTRERKAATAGSRRSRWALAPIIGTLVATVAAGPARATEIGSTTTRLSASIGGRAGNADSFAPAASGDGLVVAFSSAASNLVLRDRNGVEDVFVRDVASGRTTRVSVGPAGVEADGSSGGAAVSADGRVVAFQSAASNLVAGDTNGTYDVFVHDRAAGTTTRVSVASGGRQGDGASVHPSVSADGRVIAFSSDATNFVTGDTNAATDVFVHDRATGTTTRVSVATGGAQADGGGYSPALSGDGRVVAWTSSATNLVRGDTNGLSDVFVQDRSTATTTRVSVATDGDQANGGLLGSIGIVDVSHEGAIVAFSSDATNLVSTDTNGETDVFIRDRRSGTTTRASVATDGTEGRAGGVSPSISTDGRFAAFTSFSDNLVPSDANMAADVFVRDMAAGATLRASVGATGTEADADSGSASMSANGRVVAFDSDATNLVDREMLGVLDVFARR